MMDINAAQLRIIHTLLSKLGLSQYKAEMIADITCGRTESSKKLTFDEATLLIQRIKAMDQKATGEDKMRRRIIAMAHEMGWHTPQGGKFKIDMDRLNEWCVKFGFGKKHLDLYLYSELPKLVTQFEQGPYKHFLHRL